ncbi:uncharacterized protein LOC128398131 [Panonychus citri]|uniref:uncharacterized protein LOC128398131 n=1 Tax=Panonychus citri TaxID=50023 RepID=UPI0023079A43|nr:uncharacterized protein LOC128398131 [Panonychus citri]
MVGINCLFNYDGINYRLNINPKNGKEVITIDEFRLNLLDHPKLKEVDFFDTEKYIVEIFDKGFDDYIKFPKDGDICDYSKLRARLRPKSTLTLVRKDEETRKRPLSMYAELNMEEEHAAKVLRGSPPQNVTRARVSSPPPSSFRRSHQSISEPIRSENQSRSYTSVKTPVTSKPATPQTSSFKPKPNPSPASRPPPPPPQSNSKAQAPTKTPVVTKTPEPSTNPFSSNSSSKSISKISNNSNTPRAPGLQGIGDQLPPGADQDSYFLAKAVDKYNDEFTNIMMFDEIWETEHVWPFVYREVSGQGVQSIKSVKETRSAFKLLVDKYIATLQKTNLTEAAANQDWPLFEIFHSKLNIKPFYGRIQTLKDAFNKGPKDAGDKQSSTSAPPTPSSTSSLSQSIKTTPSIQQQQQAPKPQRTQAKVLSEDIILLSADETDKPTMRIDDDDDEIREIHPTTSMSNRMSPAPSSPQTSPPKSHSEPPQPIIVTSDDFRLLLAVEDHNKEFYDDIIPEYSVWREVTDQINLYKPFEPSLVMKYKTRFYELLQEFVRIENSSVPVSEKAQWKLYSSFINIDTEPFLSKLNNL